MIRMTSFYFKPASEVAAVVALAALCAWNTPLQAATQDPPRVAAQAHGMQYALVSDASSRFFSSSGHRDWEDVRAARSKVKGDFIWFREEGRSYVIQDAALAEKIRSAWAPYDRANVRMDTPREAVKRERTAADQAVRTLIHDARANGLAQAVGSASAAPRSPPTR